MTAFYLRTMKFAIIRQFQYRAGNYLLMAAMVVEALIYMALWQAAARMNGGAVDGWTSGSIAAYFIVWTLVRNMTITYTPYGFSERIRTGRFSSLMLRPVHPIHYDLADFAGWKFVMIAFWIPVAFVLTSVFRPSITVTAEEFAVFVVAIWGAYLIRAIYLWLLGLVSFWTTRATAVFDVFLLLELLLSGRLVPMSLLPDWASALADWLPFQWAFGFPIEALVGDLTTGQLLHGLVMQVVWVGVGTAAVALVWRFAVRRHTAVGN